jgi:hypothetical protein
VQVVTKRTKNLKKQEIPSLDDPISKLNHIGKETVKKLNELKASADEAALQLPIPPELFRSASLVIAPPDMHHLSPATYFSTNVTMTPRPPNPYF